MGSGVYIVTGAIMHNKAGPAAFLSYLLSGLAAFFSCLCYAELASRIPRAGSAYTYTYVRPPRALLHLLSYSRAPAARSRSRT